MADPNETRENRAAIAELRSGLAAAGAPEGECWQVLEPGQTVGLRPGLRQGYYLVVPPGIDPPGQPDWRVVSIDRHGTYDKYWSASAADMAQWITEQLVRLGDVDRPDT